jgi:hypothetical protein
MFCRRGGWFSCVENSLSLEEKHVSRPVIVNVPHNLGREEARRRIENGFGQLQQQLTGGMGMVSCQQRWEANRLHFEASALGQKMSGRLDVKDDALSIEVDLPEILAALADRIAGKLKETSGKLLEKK